MIYRSLSTVAGLGARAAGMVGGPDLRERLGLAGPEVAPGGIWLHGASVGEIASASVLIEGLCGRHPLIVTANTRTGRAAAQAMGVPAALAPLDTPQAVAAFLRRLRPRVAVTIENELWPNRSAGLAAIRAAQVVLGARLSERSARRWARLGPVIGPMLARLDAVSAQDAASEARLLALGLPRKALIARTNLKLMGAARTKALPHGPHRAQTLLAASTHAGEEAAVLDAVAALRAQGTPLRLILAPRHPQRFDEVAQLMAARGLAPARRSAGAGAEAPVLLADSMGEMAHWYAAAGICLTGGSLTDLGGHTPWEPASQSCAILHGPHVANFTADYAALDAGDAAQLVTAGSLAHTLCELLADPARQAAMGRRAHAILMSSAGNPQHLIDIVRNLAMR